MPWAIARDRNRELLRLATKWRAAVRHDLLTDDQLAMLMFDTLAVLFLWPGPTTRQMDQLNRVLKRMGEMVETNPFAEAA